MRAESADDLAGIRSLPKDGAESQEGAGAGGSSASSGPHLSVKGIVPIDGRNAHPLPLPRIAEEKDSPPGSREDAMRELVALLPPPPPPTTPCTPCTPSIPFIPLLKSVIKEEELHKKKEGCDNKRREGTGAPSLKIREKQ